MVWAWFVREEITKCCFGSPWVWFCFARQEDNKELLQVDSVWRGFGLQERGLTKWSFRLPWVWFGFGLRTKRRITKCCFRLAWFGSARVCKDRKQHSDASGCPGFRWGLVFKQGIEQTNALGFLGLGLDLVCTEIRSQSVTLVLQVGLGFVWAWFAARQDVNKVLL